MRVAILVFGAAMLASSVALSQQALRPGDPDPFASKPGAQNPYATKGGEPPSSVRSSRDNDRRSSREEEKGYGYAKDPHSTHLPYGTNQGNSVRKR